jgi:hypothetical protein
VSRSTPCFVALCAASTLLIGCSHPTSERVRTASGSATSTSASSPTSSTAAQSSSSSTPIEPGSIEALADRLIRSTPDDVVQCTYLDDLRVHHQKLSDPGVHVDIERPDGTVAARAEAIRALLSDRRFASVPWADATLTDAYTSADPAGALLIFAFPRPVKVPTILGVPDEQEGDATTTTDAKGFGQMRPVSPDEARQFAAAREVQVSIDLRGSSPVVALVSGRTDPELCRLSEVPEGLR